MEKTTLFALVATALIVFAGCAGQTEKSGSQIDSGSGNQPSVSESGTEEDTSITDDVSGIEDLDSELDTSEMESLDQELSDIESLFS